MSLQFVLGAMLFAQTGNDQTISAGIDAPLSIIPAISPYVECLNQVEKRLSQAAGPLHSAAMRGVVTQARAKCLTVRVSARVNALKMIVTDPTVAAPQRETAVDRALASVDHSDDVFLLEL